jgi:glycerol-3-phosphate cytidylyltransferase
MRVFRPGVFDLFHVGHLNCVKESAKLGDYLIIGIQDDRDVEKCKGKKPIIPLQERMEILSAIKGVDEVISYRNANLSKLLNALEINLLAVGNDYGYLSEYPEQSATLKYCNDNNIIIHRTPRLSKTSSTNIRNKVLDFWNDLSKSNTPTTLTSFNGNTKLILNETNKEIQLFGKHISINDKVLDLGCGNGRISIEIVKLCHQITCVDFSNNLINELKNKNINNLRAVVDDVCEYKSKEKFDIIIMSGLFPCLDDKQLESILNTCHNLLKQKGKLLIRSSMADESRIDVINQFSDSLESLYTAFYRTDKEINESMINHGFSQLGSKEILYRNHPDTHVAFMVYV